MEGPETRHDCNSISGWTTLWVDSTFPAPLIPQQNMRSPAMTPAMISGLPSMFDATSCASSQRPEPLNLLIVDEDPISRELCREAATALGCQVSLTDSQQHAMGLVGSENLDVVLLGLRMPDPKPVYEIKRQRSDVCILVMSVDSAAQPVLELLRAGASDYLIKPFGVAELKLVLERVATQLSAKFAGCQTRKQTNRGRFGGIIGCSPEMDRVLRMISLVANSAHPALILGESGTGKELVARAIHDSGPLRDKPFISVDCGSLVPTLIESELFGHAKNAFTGAVQAKQGLLAIAERGTVFLDEVGELPLDLQPKLLRVLQEKAVRPVGAVKTVPISARILAATNRDLEEATARGTFRRDLYFRLNVLNVRVPSLRERRKDIPVLINHFLERVSRSCGKRYELSDDAMQALVAYDWPGNVRELENCIERCCAMNSGPSLHSSDLPDCMSGTRRQSTSPPATRIVRLADMEKDAIVAAIKQLNGDKLMASRLLGIGKTTLYRKLKQYQVSQ